MIAVAALVGTLLLATCGGDNAEPIAPSPQPTAVESPVAAPLAPSPQPAAVESPVAAPPLAFPEFIEAEEPLEAPSDVPKEMKAVWEVWSLLTREHVDQSKLEQDEFTEAAIRGALAALEDPHTYYINKEAFEIQNQDLRGEFEGIGATVSMRVNGKLIIVSPLDGSPAEAAGLRSGDTILEVDGESIEGLSLLEAVARIRGPRGTRVKLLILHLGAIDPIEIAVVRDTIPQNSVLLRSEPGSRIAHIRLTDFYADTANRLVVMIQQVVADGAEGLILDVRDNLGGLLNSAVDVTSQFLSEGLVLYQIDGKGNQTNYSVRRGGVATDIPLVVLANGFSASGSEVLVGALQDHHRATIVGETTFGKGSVGVFLRLSNGGGVAITTGRFFTTSGRLIEGKGLEPDIEVTSRDRQKAESTQLEKAIEVLESQLATGLGDSETAS
jgi:carboxyl-terminal processing protease